jgi:hypothetical protein
MFEPQETAGLRQPRVEPSRGQAVPTAEPTPLGCAAQGSDVIDGEMSMQTGAYGRGCR